MTTKEDIISYALNTPGNTNPAVLSGMLDSVADAGGGDSSTYIVTFSYDTNKWVADKSFADVAQAFSDGKYVVGRIEASDGTSFVGVNQSPLQYDNPTGIVFNQLAVSGSTIFYTTLLWFAYDSSIQFTKSSIVVPSQQS